MLISGGGSALLPFPVSEISLKDKILTNKLLISSGANIKEIISKNKSALDNFRLGLFYWIFHKIKSDYNHH